MKKALVILMVMMLQGCYAAHVKTSANPGIKHSETNTSLFWGLTKVKVTALECEKGLSEVKSYWPWYSGLVSFFTAGIVTPIKTEYTCTSK